MNEEQKTWNERWADKDFSDGWQADAWLVKHSDQLESGTAIDIACGRGRNALFLASQGYHVTAVDYSDVALGQLSREAQRRNLDIATLLTDLEDRPQLPQHSFDLAISFYFLHRPLLPRLKELVAPSGLIIIRTFTTAGDGEPCRLKPEMVLEPGELRDTFRDWEILVDEEGLEPSKKGGTLAGIIARKPST